MDRTSARSRRFGGPLLALVALGALLAGCGDDGGDDEFSATTSTTVSEESTTTDADTTTTAPEEESREQSGSGPWAATAADRRGEVGTTATFECPGGGEAGSLWGVNIYTDDSSVCTAAVQMGLITFEEGGSVTIEILEGQDSYTGAEANGVTSKRYASWGGSFEFPDATPLEVSQLVEWNASARELAGKPEGTFTVDCPPEGTAGNLWGTGTYTDDSSVCTAAVHAGVITQDGGGEVTFTMLPGEESYQGSTANDITSNDYGSWSGSFRIDS
jgi:hypothetical protein